MEAVVRKLRIQTLKAEVELFRLEGDSLARKFNLVQSNEEKSQVAREWDKAIKAKRAAQTLLDLEERKARESTTR